MSGTIIITGANGSLAVHTIQRLLSSNPDLTLLLTVRDPSEKDANTEELRSVIACHTKARTIIRQLDLANLSAVHDFAATIAAEIAGEKLPRLVGIVCNAYYWNLASDPPLTVDGFETTFQINHIAHAALVLPLLGSFAPEGGRVTLLSSDAHWPGKNSLEKYPPCVPDDLDDWVMVLHAGDADKQGRGMNRYANSKLAVVSWMYALNRRLEQVLLHS